MSFPVAAAAAALTTSSPMLPLTTQPSASRPLPSLAWRQSLITVSQANPLYVIETEIATADATVFEAEGAACSGASNVVPIGYGQTSSLPKPAYGLKFDRTLSASEVFTLSFSTWTTTIAGTTVGTECITMGAPVEGFVFQTLT